MEISNSHFQVMAASHPLGEIIASCPKPHQQQHHHQQHQEQQDQQQQLLEKKPRPNPEHALKCPRCDSTNTKFCYYNNYSLSQPRYFCKGCRRYWTQGGSLRNVPIGGGCRKNRRSSSARKFTTTDNQTQAFSTPLMINSTGPAATVLQFPTIAPSLPYDHSDLTLAFARLHSHEPFHLLANPKPAFSSHLGGAPPGFLNFLRNGFIDTAQHNPAAVAGFHNFCYGFGSAGGVAEEVATDINQHGIGSQEIVVPAIDRGAATATSTPSSTPTTSTSQGSSCKLVDGGDNSSKLTVGGFQWKQHTADGILNNNIDPATTARDLWNGSSNGSTWHGDLVNSSLM